MPDMPRKRPPHVLREVTRHGKIKWYVRVGRGSRIRVAAFGAPEFDVEYEAAIQGRQPRRIKGAPAAGTLSWLITRYRETTAWTTLSMEHDANGRTFSGRLSRHPARNQSAPSIRQRSRPGATVERRTRADTFSIPCAGCSAGPRRPSTRKTRHLELKTRRGQRALAFRFGPRSTLRRSISGGRSARGNGFGSTCSCIPDCDAATLGRQHVPNGSGTLTTEKTGTDVTLTILPVLAETLKAGPCGDLTFIVGADGRAFVKEAFGNAFREACRKAGVPGSAHGVRKLAATTMAENGATEAQLEAVFGWTGGRMASLYTRSANRRRLATSSAHLLVNEERTDLPAPEREVRGKRRKRQH